MKISYSSMQILWHEIFYASPACRRTSNFSRSHTSRNILPHHIYKFDYRIVSKKVWFIRGRDCCVFCAPDDVKTLPNFRWPPTHRFRDRAKGSFRIYIYIYIYFLYKWSTCAVGFSIFFGPHIPPMTCPLCGRPLTFTGF